MPKSVKGVMDEWKGGDLHSGSSNGPVVTNRKQAIAIALSEQKKKGKTKPSPRDESDGTFSGPAGPFGTLKSKPRAFRGNAPTFAGRRTQSRQQYQSVDPINEPD